MSGWGNCHHHAAQNLSSSHTGIHSTSELSHIFCVTQHGVFLPETARFRLPWQRGRIISGVGIAQLIHTHGYRTAATQATRHEDGRACALSDEQFSTAESTRYLGRRRPSVSVVFVNGNCDNGWRQNTVARTSRADSLGTGARAPAFTNGWARGYTVSRRTANKKLNKLY